jgi:hypothetical protein
MAKFVATDYKVVFGTANFSNLVAAVTLEFTAEEQDVTSFGTAGFRERITGLKDGTLTVDFMQDFAAGSVDAYFWSNLGSAVGVTLTPTSGSVTSSNPSYSGTVVITGYSPLASSVGDLATFSLSLPTSSVWVRATA